MNSSIPQRTVTPPTRLARRGTFWMISWLIAGGLQIGFCSAKAVEQAELLDKVIVSGTGTVRSYKDILVLAEAKSGKRVKPSEVFRLCAAEGLGPRTRVVFRNTAMSLRDYLNNLTFMTDIVWRYDETKDVLVFDFTWNRPDARPAKELFEVIKSSVPPLLDTCAGIPKADDAWRVAFDGLICKDENRGACLVRAKANATILIMVSGGAVNHLCSGKIRDARGREYFLVTSLQKKQINPGEGSIAYYLFDFDGRFVSGGVFTAGWRRSEVSGEILPGGETLRVQGMVNGRTPRSETYRLLDGALVQEEAKDAEKTIYTGAAGT